MEQKYQVKTPQDFQVIIEAILNWYKNSQQENLVIALQGDLGAGKTTFTQELGRYLKITEPITSPTFTIMKQYELDDESFDSLVHIDAYRIEDEAEAGPLKLSGVLQKPRTLVCLEWPEQIPSVVPDTAVKVKIEIGEGETRNVAVSLPS